MLRESDRLRHRFPDHPVAQSSFTTEREMMVVGRMTGSEDDPLLLLPHLATEKNPSHAVFSFLSNNNKEREYINLLWLYDNSCLSNNSSLHRDKNLALKLLFHIELYTHEGGYSEICFYRSKSCDMASLVGPIDAILLLLAKHRTASRINLVEYTFVDEPTPFSCFALKAYVSEAASPRRIDFEGFFLTIEEWRTLLFNSNPNVMLHFVDDWAECGHAVIESIMTTTTLSNSNSINSNQCVSSTPARLDLAGIDTMPDDTFHALVNALAVTTCLSELKLTHSSNEEYRMISLYGAISQNQVLEKVSLSARTVSDLSDLEWEAFWAAVGSHPTLASIELFSMDQGTILSPLVSSSSLSTSSSSSSFGRSKERDQILVNAVRSNKAGVLCELEVSSNAVCDPQAVEEQVQPVLEHNRLVYYYSITAGGGAENE